MTFGSYAAGEPRQPNAAAVVEEAMRTDPRYANFVATATDAEERLFDLLDGDDNSRHERCWSLIDAIIAHAPLRYLPEQYKPRKDKVSSALVPCWAGQHSGSDAAARCAESIRMPLHALSHVQHRSEHLQVGLPCKSIHDTHSRAASLLQVINAEDLAAWLRDQASAAAQASKAGKAQAIRPLARKGRKQASTTTAAHLWKPGNGAVEDELAAEVEDGDGEPVEAEGEEFLQSELALQSLPQAWRHQIGRKVLWRKMPLPDTNHIPVSGA